MVAQQTTTIGERIREARRTKGLTQEELAAQAGMARQQINALERARHSPQAKTLRRISAALGLTPEEITAPAASTTPATRPHGSDGPQRQYADTKAMARILGCSQSNMSHLLTNTVLPMREGEEYLRAGNVTIFDVANVQAWYPQYRERVDEMKRASVENARQARLRNVRRAPRPLREPQPQVAAVAPPADPQLFTYPGLMDTLKEISKRLGDLENAVALALGNTREIKIASAAFEHVAQEQAQRVISALGENDVALMGEVARIRTGVEGICASWGVDNESGLVINGQKH